MKNILVIFKKELKRCFTDRRMLLGMFLPGILIFLVYTLMGKIFTNSSAFSTTTKDTTYQVVYTDNYNTDKTNQPKLLSFVDNYFQAEANNNKVEATAINKSEFTTYMDKLKANEIHLLITFTDDFENQLVVSNAKNSVNMYFNSEKTDSQNIYSIANELVGSAYNNYQVNFDFETNKQVVSDVGTKNAMMGKILAFILPMVTVSLLYSTVLSFCPEAISGEKERGTLASMLLTPIKRSEFVIGKILGLSLVAVLSGTTTFIGLIASLPTLIGVSSLPITIPEMLLLFVIIVSTLLVFVGFGVLVSSLANTVKEATTYLAPLSILIMVLAMVPAIAGLNSIWLGFVPVLNLSVCISQIMAQSSSLALLLGITAISNLVYCGILVFFATQLFKKEKVVLGQ